jgi:hypothetical protein
MHLYRPYYKTIVKRTGAMLVSLIFKTHFIKRKPWNEIRASELCSFQAKSYIKFNISNLNSL